MTIITAGAALRLDSLFYEAYLAKPYRHSLDRDFCWWGPYSDSLCVTDAECERPGKLSKAFEAVKKLVAAGHGTRPLPSEETKMSKRQRVKFVHEGKYLAEVDVELLEDETEWSPTCR